MCKAILKTAFGAIAAIVLAGGSTAYAQCAPEYEAGFWRNSDSNTRSITWVEIDARCNDVWLNGQPPAGDPFSVALWGKCHPNDCFWGERGAQRDAEGWIRTTYRMGYATKYVWIRGYPGYSVDWLRVYIWTDFHDGRTDYSSDNWMTRFRF